MKKPIPEFRLMTFICLRCDRMWYPRKPVKPTVCPRCHSPYWNMPKNIKKDIDAS